MLTQSINTYQIYQGKREEKIQLFIAVKGLSPEEAEAALKPLSDMLQQRLEKSWKCLPSSSLPEAYNIITLPYKCLV